MLTGTKYTIPRNCCISSEKFYLAEQRAPFITRVSITWEGSLRLTSPRHWKEELKSEPYNPGPFSSEELRDEIQEMEQDSLYWYLGISASCLAILIIAALLTAYYIKRFKVDGDVLANVLTDVELLQAGK